MDEVFTVQEVADRLKVHVMSVYKLIGEGTLRATHVPGVGVRVEAKELEKLLDQNVKKVPTKPRRKSNAKTT